VQSQNAEHCVLPHQESPDPPAAAASSSSRSWPGLASAGKTRIASVGPSCRTLISRRRELDAELLLHGRLGIIDELLAELRIALGPGDELFCVLSARGPSFSRRQPDSNQA
jgi:hypothetical protein